MDLQAKYFSNHFNIPKIKLDELGVFDPILNIDTKVFVEPFLLKRSSSKIIQYSYENYKNFFSSLLLLLQKSAEPNDRCWRAAKNLVNFPEYQYTCIGYGASSTDGRGSGAEFNDKILKSAKEIVSLAENSPEIFLLLPLLEKGIAGDRISDMVQNIIDEDICQYTKEIMNKICIDGNYDHITKNNNQYKLLLNPYSNTVIKLIPKDILSNLPLADDISSVIETMTSTNIRLRNVVNRDIGEIWRDTTKSYRQGLLLKELKTNKEFFLETLKALKEHQFEHYDLDKDHEGLYKWLENSQDFLQIELSKETKHCNNNLESLASAIKGIIAHFRDIIENKDIWRTFWTKYGSEYKHVRVFYSQMLFFTVCNTWLTSQGSNINVQLKQEGQNFLLEFSISQKHLILVYVKHANNPSIYSSYKNILEISRDSHNLRNYYIIINFKTEITNQLKKVKIIENSICKIIQINVVQKELLSESRINEKTNNTMNNFLEFEDLKFTGYNYVAEKSKAAKARHHHTTTIKNNIIQNMFNYRREENSQAKVSDITNLIIHELQKLAENQSNIKIQNFAQKYSITSEENIKIIIDYLDKHNDGGQISTWCYAFNKQHKN